MAIGNVTKTNFTDQSDISNDNIVKVKKVNIDELRNAISKLQTYSSNVDNCGNCLEANQTNQNATICESIKNQSNQENQGCQSCQSRRNQYNQGNQDCVCNCECFSCG